LRDRGWIEGSNLLYLFRFAEGVAERHAGNARELVEAGVDLIVAVTGTAALAAKRSSDTVPIVFANVPNPVEMGLVASIARPQGNLTGLTTLGLDMAGKRMELLKEVFPKASRVAFLVTGRQAQFDRSVYGYAEKLGIQLLSAKVARAEQIKNVMTEMADVDAWFINEEAIFFTERRTIIELAATQRKPAMYPSTFFVDAGGLISYSVGQPGQYGRLAALADRILHGYQACRLARRAARGI
jgi:putative ABC transport system substrate-binding protein